MVVHHQETEGGEGNAETQECGDRKGEASSEQTTAAHAANTAAHARTPQAGARDAGCHGMELATRHCGLWKGGSVGAGVGTEHGHQRQARERKRGKSTVQ